jgi:hypothetical protein
MFGSFLNSSEIASFQVLFTAGCGCVVDAIVASTGFVSVGVVVVSTGEAVLLRYLRLV